MASKRPIPKHRIKKAYDKPDAGEWVQPIMRGYKLACCDCGLVHLMNFRIKNGRPQFAVFRANRESAAMRKTPHDFLPSRAIEDMAASFMKKTGKKSVVVGTYRIRLKT